MTNRTNPQHGANMVDRYIGSAFDVVYAVYKELGNMPVFLEFVTETSPRMEEQYADIIGRFDHIVELEASALNSKEVAVQAAEDAMEYRDTTQALIDEAEEFKQFVINVVENTIQDIEDRFAEFIVASGYEFIGNYGIGIEVTEYNQLLRDVNGEFWRLSGQRSIPYITTGAGLPEDDAFIPVGDASLRQDLDDPIHGSKLIKYDEDNTVYDAISRNREDFWANKETLGGIYTHYVREDDGTPVAGAECAVYVGKSGVLATGLKDKFGEPLANPFVSDANGLVQFVADPGMYTLQVSFDLVVHTYSVYFADEQVRADLANPDKGAAMVARGVVAVDSIADLLALPEGQRKEGLRYLVKGYYAGSDVGGGEFYWDSERNKADHDGGMVLDPLKLSDWDGTHEGHDSLFVPLNIGTGCFVRLLDGLVHSDMYGIIADDYASDQYEALRNFLRGVGTLGPSYAVPRNVDVHINGGFRAEVKSNQLMFPNARYWSDKKAIRLPFTTTFAATDPEFAVEFFGGEYHGLDLDGFRAAGGMGTSPTPPSLGQGALIAFSGARSYLYECVVHGAVNPNLVTFSPERAPVLTDCHIYDAGEHHCYFSGNSDGARFIRCTFGAWGQNPDHNGRGALLWKYRADIGNPVVDCKFIDCTVSAVNTNPHNPTMMFTSLTTDGVTDWRLKQFVIDGLIFTEEDQTSRIGNIAFHADGALISNMHFSNITNCPPMFLGGESIGVGVIFSGNTAKNISFRTGCEGVALFDYCENLSVPATSRRFTLGAAANATIDVFKRGSKTVINGLYIGPLSGNGALDLHSYIGRDVVIRDLVVNDVGAGGTRTAPIEIGQGYYPTPVESGNQQRYILKNADIETSKSYSIYSTTDSRVGGVELILDGGRVNKFLRSFNDKLRLEVKNGFIADFTSTATGEMTLVAGTKPVTYSSDESCTGTAFYRKITMPAGQTQVNVALSTSNAVLKVRDMEYVSRATPMGQYPGSAWVQVIGFGATVRLNVSEAPAGDLDFLVEVRLHKD